MSRGKHLILVSGIRHMPRFSGRMGRCWTSSLSDLPGLQGLSVSTAVEPDANFAMIEIWGTGCEEVYAAVVREGYATMSIHPQERIERTDARLAGPGPIPGVKQVSLLQMREDLSARSARALWDEHVPLALAVHVGCAKYVRDWIGDSGCGGIGAVASLSYPSRADYEEHRYADAEGKAAITNDVARFVGKAEVMLMQETIFRAPPREAACSPPSVWSGPA